MVMPIKKILNKSFLIGVLFTCVLIGLSSAPIFAASEDSPSSEVSSWLAPDLDSVQAKEVAEQLSDRAVAADYTTTDIYNLLYSALRGESFSSSYSLPKIASFTDRISQILYGSGQAVPTQSLYANLREIHEILNGLNSGVYVRPDIQSTLFRTDPTTADFITLSQDAGSILAQTQLSYAVLNQLHGDAQNNSYYLSQINSKLSSFDWQSAGTYLGAINSSTGQGTSSWVTGVKDWTFGFRFNSSSYSSVQPNLIRLYVPFDSWTEFGSANIDLVDIYSVSGNSWIHAQYDYNNVFIEPSPNYGTYIYLFDFKDFNLGSSLYFRCVYTGSGSPQMSGDRSGVAQILSFDSDSYQQIKQAFYQQKAALAQGSMASDLDRLANYLADPDKLAAENASQAVIDDTLDGFTGNGSAAAKTSDTGSMKNMSGSIQSGLNSGASASNAASVFSNQTFWSWFTQSTSDGINNPYPAPVVQNNRAPGDYVPDFLSGNQSELNDLLNQRNSW